MTIKKTNERMQELAQKWRNGTITESEKTEFDNWYNSFDDSELQDVSGETPGKLKERLYQAIHENIHSEDENVVSLKPNRQWLWYAAATSLAAFLTVGGYFLLLKKPAQQIAQNQIHDIAPGTNKAILSSHGKIYVLDSTKNGVLVSQGDLSITKSPNGLVSYQSSASSGKPTAVVYDTLTIPRGGQHQLLLADGSKVWLNAATQIRYPESFTGKERKIELIYGEVDIDVKHNAEMPFKVLVKGQTIEDIGTNFNINAYDDEPSVKTTLLEGIAKISKANQKVILKPGQQSATQTGNNSITVKEIDPETAIDWKNGEFDLKHESLASIMRKVSRWYDVKIVYSPNINNNVTYSGSVSRYGNVSKVLESLETTGDTKFKIEGRQITVIK